MDIDAEANLRTATEGAEDIGKYLAIGGVFSLVIWLTLNNPYTGLFIIIMGAFIIGASRMLIKLLNYDAKRKLAKSTSEAVNSIEVVGARKN